MASAAQGPPRAPPPGLTDVNQGLWLLPLDWILRALAIIIVALRLYTRKVAKNTFGWDDATIAIATVVAVAGGITETLQVANGFGRHAAFLTDAQLEANGALLPASQMCNFISIFFTRTSVCLFVLRLLPPTQKWASRVIYAALLLNFLSTLANCLLFSLQCHPTPTNPTAAPSNGCASEAQLRVGFTIADIFSILVDFMNVGIPVFVIRNLQMSRRLKIQISIIMSLGLLTAACSIGKVLAVRNIVDVTWDGVPVEVWGLFEESCGIIFASMPVMRQFYKVVTGRMSSRVTNSTPSRSNPSADPASRAEKGISYGGGGSKYPYARQRQDPAMGSQVSLVRYENGKATDETVIELNDFDSSPPR